MKHHAGGCPLPAAVHCCPIISARSAFARLTLGAIHWARLLLSRVKQTMAKLCTAQPSGEWRATPAGTAVHDRYLSLARCVMHYERDAFRAWAAGADAAAIAALKQPILAKDAASGAVGVNFARELRTLMLEARYLDRQRWEVPPVALQVGARRRGGALGSRRSHVPLSCACIAATMPGDHDSLA